MINIIVRYLKIAKIYILTVNTILKIYMVILKNILFININDKYNCWI